MPHHSHWHVIPPPSTRRAPAAYGPCQVEPTRRWRRQVAIQWALAGGPGPAADVECLVVVPNPSAAARQAGVAAAPRHWRPHSPRHSPARVAIARAGVALGSYASRARRQSRRRRIAWRQLMQSGHRQRARHRRARASRCGRPPPSPLRCHRAACAACVIAVTKFLGRCSRRE